MDPSPTTLPTAIPLPPGHSLVAGHGRLPARRASPPHHHPEGQLVGSAKGLFTVGTEGGVWVLTSGQGVWLPPNHVHWTRSHGPFDGWTAYVAEESCARLPSEVRVIEVTNLLREALLRAASWPARPRDAAELRVIDVIIDEIVRAATNPFLLPLPKDPRLLRVAEALLEAPADDRGLDAWAALGAVSERTLSRRFVTETGFSFSSWKQRARIVRALELLAAGQSVTAIALDLGYSTASAFVAVFKRVVGTTPSAWASALPACDRSRPKARLG